MCRGMRCRVEKDDSGLQGLHVVPLSVSGTPKPGHCTAWGVCVVHKLDGSWQSAPHSWSPELLSPRQQAPPASELLAPWTPLCRVCRTTLAPRADASLATKLLVPAYRLLKLMTSSHATMFGVPTDRLLEVGMVYEVL